MLRTRWELELVSQDPPDGYRSDAQRYERIGEHEPRLEIQAGVSQATV